MPRWVSFCKKLNVSKIFGNKANYFDNCILWFKKYMPSITQSNRWLYAEYFKKKILKEDWAKDRIIPLSLWICLLNLFPMIKNRFYTVVPFKAYSSNDGCTLKQSAFSLVNLKWQQESASRLYLINSQALNCNHHHLWLLNTLNFPNEKNREHHE